MVALSVDTELDRFNLEGIFANKKKEEINNKICTALLPYLRGEGNFMQATTINGGMS